MCSVLCYCDLFGWPSLPIFILFKPPPLPLFMTLWYDRDDKIAGYTVSLRLLSKEQGYTWKLHSYDSLFRIMKYWLLLVWSSLYMCVWNMTHHDMDFVSHIYLSFYIDTLKLLMNCSRCVVTVLLLQYNRLNTSSLLIKVVWHTIEIS